MSCLSPSFLKIQKQIKTVISFSSRKGNFKPILLFFIFHFSFFIFRTVFLKKRKLKIEALCRTMSPTLSLFSWKSKSSFFFAQHSKFSSKILNIFIKKFFCSFNIFLKISTFLQKVQFFCKTSRVSFKKC